MADDWIISTKNELNKRYDLECPSSASILKAPRPLRDVRPFAFTPQTVAIGPYHRNLPFSDMQRFKILAANAIARDMTAGDFGHLVQDVARAQEEVRSYYDRDLDLEEDLTAEKLAFMVSLDAALVIAVLHSFFNEHVGRRIELSVDDLPSRFHFVYAHHFSLPVRKSIMHDFVLLENQIPLFLLLKVIQMDSRCKSEEEAERRLESFIGTMACDTLPFTKSQDIIAKGIQGTAKRGKHLLDCLYTIITSSNQKMQESADADALDFDPAVLSSATQLYNSGVRFRGHNGSLMDVSFEHGILTIPKIHVGDDTESIFRNLVAYESHMEGKVNVLSYLHFMNFLINTPEDVGVLVETGIITQTIGSNKHVARMWNALCTNTVTVFSKRYSEVAQAAKRHTDLKIHGLVAEFMRAYCSRPWLFLSLISGVALLVMSFLTMFYTIELYKQG